MHLGRRLPVASCGLPRDGAGLPEFPYLALLHVGFTELPASPPTLVGSYPTVPPLPFSGRERLLYERRYCFCGTCLGFPPLGVTQHAARGVPTFLYRKHRSTWQRFPCLVDRDVIRLPVALLLWWRIIGID